MASNMSVAKYKFESEPEDDLVCLICLEVAEVPWQHSECGRLLCKKCLDKLGKDKPCPSCRVPQPQYFADSRSKRVIRALPVKCDNVERGCRWVGTVATLEEHVATCSFALLLCPKQCKYSFGQVKCFMRRDLDKHLKEDCPNRIHTCEYCGEKGTYAHITETHNTRCPKKILPCLNVLCPKSIECQKLGKHVKTECEYTMIPCKYCTELGCETEMKRKDMAAHEEDDKRHLHMAINIIAQLRKKQDDTIILKGGESILFELTEFQDKKKRNVECYCHPFYTSRKGYYMNIDVDVNGTGSGEGTHVSLYASLLKGDNDDKLSWPFVGEVTITLLNQLEDKNHFSKTVNILAEDKMKAGIYDVDYSKFIRHSKLGYNTNKNTQYLKDDTLYFRVFVSIPNNKPYWLQCTAN